jgi:hypothetical protein
MSFSPSHPVQDADYLLSRAAAEAEAAESAPQPESAEAHHRLASLYLDQLFGPSDSVPPHAVPRRIRASERSEVVEAPFRMMKPVGDASDFTDLLIRLP